MHNPGFSFSQAALSRIVKRITETKDFPRKSTLSYFLYIKQPDFYINMLVIPSKMINFAVTLI